MLRLFYPFEYAESVFTLDYNRLYALGYRGIIFDLDNTLVPHGEGSTPEVDRLFEELRNIGFKTVILSDNGVKRIETFLENIDSEYIDNANKPNPKSFKRAAELLGLKRKEVIYIGDQIFTDILGANLAGIDSILVKYIGYYDNAYKGKRREAEEVILKKYKKSKKYYERLGNIEIREKSDDFRKV